MFVPHSIRLVYSLVRWFTTTMIIVGIGQSRSVCYYYSSIEQILGTLYRYSSIIPRPGDVFVQGPRARASVDLCGEACLKSYLHVTELESEMEDLKGMLGAVSSRIGVIASPAVETGSRTPVRCKYGGVQTPPTCGSNEPGRQVEVKFSFICTYIRHILHEQACYGDCSSRRSMYRYRWVASVSASRGSIDHLSGISQWPRAWCFHLVLRRG